MTSLEDLKFDIALLDHSYTSRERNTSHSYETIRRMGPRGFSAEVFRVRFQLESRCQNMKLDAP